MTVSDLWQDIGAGENIVTKFLRLVFLLAAAVIFTFWPCCRLPGRSRRCAAY